MSTPCQPRRRRVPILCIKNLMISWSYGHEKKMKKNAKKVSFFHLQDAVIIGFFGAEIGEKV